MTGTSFVSRHPRLSTAAGGVAIVAVILLENIGAGPLDRMLRYLPGIDKVLHVAQSLLIFFALLYMGRWVHLSTSLRMAVAVLGTIALALFDEWQQYLMGGRSVEAADVQAGLSGVLLGVGMVARARRPNVALAVITAAAVLGVYTTYDSYITTKDYRRGLLYQEAGDLKGAHRAFLQALANGVESADLFNALAWTEVESGEGDPHRAVGYAERSLAMRPADPDTLDTYGWALHKAGRSKEALAPLQMALARKPRIYCIHYHLGAAYLDLGEIELARRHLQLQIDQEPFTIEAEKASTILRRLNAPPGGG